ncbi:MAG: DUF222 domain-containing protein [Actinomycetes bacterium]
MPDVLSAISTQVAHMHGLLDSMLGDAGKVERESSAPRQDDRLRKLLVRCEQLKNIADATQALVMTEMGREALARDAAERGDTDRPIRSHEEFVPDEISVLLACTKASAALRYGTAWRADRHAALGRAWRAGAIDARKVSLIAEQIQVLDPALAEQLAVEAAHYAADRTPTQTKEWLRRKVLALDPAAAERRRVAALLDRRVVITPASDGMSELWAWLPSIEARRIQQALSQLAHGIGGDDARTMDQRRADIVIDLLLGRAAPTAVDLQLVVPLATAQGSSQEPGWVPGLGPVSAAQLRGLLGCGDCGSPRTPDSPSYSLSNSLPSVLSTVDLVVVDPASGRLTDLVETGYRPSPALDRAVRARDVTCRFPGCRRAASGKGSGTDLDHTVPWPQGPTRATNLAVLCRRHHRLKHSGDWQVMLHADGTMTWITPTGRRYQTESWQYTDPDCPESDEAGSRDVAGGNDAPDPPALE